MKGATFQVGHTSPLRKDVTLSEPSWCQPGKLRARWMILYRRRADGSATDARLIDLRPWWLRIVELPKVTWWRVQDWWAAKAARRGTR